MARTDDRDARDERQKRAGQWLRRAREQVGVSSRRMAEAMEITTAMLSAYELGRHGFSDERAEQIARTLRMDLVAVRRGLGLWVPERDAPPLPDDPDERLEVLLDQAAGILREGGVLGRKEVESAVDYLRFLATQRDKSVDE